MRVQFDISDNRVDDLNALQEKTQVTTRKDVFENAVAIFEWAVKQRAKGRLIGAYCEKTKEFFEITMPALENVKEVRRG